jgi:hypothetical protein
VAINANTTYIASYHAPNGHYAATNNYFASGGFDSAPLHALGDGVDGANGVYKYGPSGGLFSGGGPDTFQASNYWVDVVFEPADATSPETTITSGPTGLTRNATPTFRFSSSELGSTFECRFDSAPFGPCSGARSHTPSSPLADGRHTFRVRAVDAADNADPTPAHRSFTVDTVRPARPTITATNPPSPANDNNPEVIGTAEAGSTVKIYTGTGCSGSPAAQGSASAFASPGITVPVPDNSTTAFHARATDRAGNNSPCSTGLQYIEDSMPAQRAFTGNPRETG